MGLVARASFSRIGEQFELIAITRQEPRTNVARHPNTLPRPGNRPKIFTYLVFYKKDTLIIERTFEKDIGADSP